MIKQPNIEKIDVGVDLNKGEVHISFGLRENKICAYGFSVPIQSGIGVLSTFCRVYGGHFPSSFFVATSSRYKTYAKELVPWRSCSLINAEQLLHAFINGEPIYESKS
jgi:hypothetical protein